MNVFVDFFYVPMKCPCCGETTFIVCNKDGDVVDVIQNDICKEHLNAQEIQKKDEKKVR